MHDEDEKLLRDGLFEPPPGFAQQLMAQISGDPFAAPNPRPWRLRLQGLAWIGTAAIAAFELASFMFGVWTTLNAH